MSSNYYYVINRKIIIVNLIFSNLTNKTKMFPSRFLIKTSFYTGSLYEKNSIKKYFWLTN